MRVVDIADNVIDLQSPYCSAAEENSRCSRKPSNVSVTTAPFHRVTLTRMALEHDPFIIVFDILSATVYCYAWVHDRDSCRMAGDSWRVSIYIP